MKLAIAQSGHEVATHFGRCPHYGLVVVEDGRVISHETIDNPGHEPGFLPGYLAERGVECIIAGGMGPRARDLFIEQGIEVIVGVTGLVDETITAYLDGQLTAGNSLCEHEG